MLFLSLLGVVVFGLLIALTINYSVVMWENKRITDLTSKIKTDSEYNNPVLDKDPNSHGFTSRDLGDTMSKSKSIQTANFDARKLVPVNSDDLPQWAKTLWNFLLNLRTNFFSQIKRLVSYLFSLVKPPEIDDLAKQQKEQVEVSVVVEKVKNATDKESSSLVLSSTDNSVVVDSASVEVVSDGPEEIPEFLQKQNQKTEQAKDSGLFDKLEDKILEKLKKVGLSNYDIWLDLAKLYEDFEQKEKAMEVYTMILKHADGKEKDVARDRLIAIN